MNDQLLMSIEKWCTDNDPANVQHPVVPVTNTDEGGVFMNALALEGNTNEILSSSFQEQCTGCMILMNMAMQASGYNPLDPYSDQNQKNFDNFLKIISSCPLFSLEFSESTHYSLVSKNADQLIDEISSVCNAGEEKDVKQVKESIKKLVKSAFSHAKQIQTSDTTDIKRVRLEFHGDLWDKYKDKFDSKYASTVDDWAQKYSTPTGPKKVALTCFRRRH